MTSLATHAVAQAIPEPTAPQTIPLADGAQGSDPAAKTSQDADTTTASPSRKGETSIDKAAAAHHFNAAKGEPSVQSSEDITVTGSRLEGGDPTTQLTVITAEEIKAKGVTSVEDLIRTLPQNLATIGAITNNRTKGPLVAQSGPSGTPIVSGVGALGVSAANLGGVGAGNTLILVNGRRMAAAAGIEAGFVNLNGIPLGAIERVEISTGGQAAIYGADALGGVINFILKSNYVGTTLSAQRLLSSGGADVTRLSGYSGYAWGSGNVSGTVEWTRRNPIVNAKTGYVTNNYAPLFGGNPVYDGRSLTAGLQPGVIDRPAIYDPDTGQLLQPETGLTVPIGFSGRPGVGDFITVGLNNARDYVPEYAGPFTDSLSGTLNFEQKITGKLSVFATGLWTRSTSTQLNASLNGLNVTLAPGQYYNPFPAYSINAYDPGATVSYFPSSELADGTIDPGRVSNVTTTWNANVGLRYDPSSSTRIELIYTASSSRTHGTGNVLGNVVNFAPDPNAPNGVSCTNYLLQNNLLAPSELAAYQAVFNRQCLALTSTDPNVAFNPFKSTSKGGGSITDFLFVPPGGADALGSILHDVELHVTGRAWTLPAGSIRYAVGGEYAHTSTEYSNVSSLSGQSVSPDRYAVFGEMTIPVLGKDFGLPLARRLEVTLAARRDVTRVTGPVGTVNNVPVDQGGTPILATNRFGRTTPSAGVLWSPFRSLDLRAKYTTGFKAPPGTQLFNQTGTYVYTTTIVNDPLYTCTVNCNDNGSYGVPSRFAANPDLKPETSVQWIYSATWKPSGPLQGLNLGLTYNRNTIRNQFANLQDLLTTTLPTDAYRVALIYPRDATGRIIQQNNFTFNILGSRYESLTLDASYYFSTGIGSFTPQVILVRNLMARRTGLTQSAVVDNVGTILGPDRYRLNGTLQWAYRSISANIFVYHTPSYTNDYLTSRFGGKVLDPELITRVAPLTTIDLSVAWAVRPNINLQFTGRNILKTAAPFTVVGTLPYDTARYDVAGRTLSGQIQFTF